ncbi:MAG: hypothetical protein AAB691_01485 [Patescibacteria group bacterium]
MSLDKSEATGLIRITAGIVHGKLDVWIRRSWYGLELPCLPKAGAYSDLMEAMDRRVTLSDEVGFLVPEQAGIAVLAKYRVAAALKLRECGFPHADQYFFFSWKEAKIVRGVELATIVHVNEEDRGNPFR